MKAYQLIKYKGNEKPVYSTFTAVALGSVVNLHKQQSRKRNILFACGPTYFETAIFFALVLRMS
jgi:hypothetical protein